ncbi:BRCA2-interacting transcriptional repressor EMSY isoform X2 [Dicentrarchus labrax]|uniref:BRCA2-interacting transcriptional repressor EMSY isoform X2 n=1 Tax=Dicentrarchus labrax TaxID=13489 RepID=UPI0021F5AEF3|nr:BRCA2-interacting transcriptional repressor EMSY isoform X2 [Dicentrarchus labrax]
MPMIQLEKPVLAGTMPVVWPTILDLGRDECKRILRKLELEAYAGVISALRAQGDLTKDKKDLLGELTKILGISTERHRAEVRRAVNDERLTTIAYHMSGPNSSSEWSIEGRRLVPLMPRLVPQTAFTVTANAVASATANQNASLLLPAETGNKEVVVCYSYTSTTCTSTSATATSGTIGATVKSPRPPSPSSNVVVLPSGSTVYVKNLPTLLPAKVVSWRTFASLDPTVRVGGHAKISEVPSVVRPTTLEPRTDRERLNSSISGFRQHGGVSCSDEDEKPRKRRRTNSSSSSPVMLKEVTKVSPQVSKNITVPVSGSPKMSNIMQSIANSLPPHLSPVKITFTKPTIQTTNTTTQKVIIVTTSPSSNFVPNILSKSHTHNNAALSKLGSASMLNAQTQKQTVVFPASSSPSSNANTVAVTTVVSSTPSVVMSTVSTCAASAGVKVASARLPSPKTLVGSPAQILAQFPKQQSPKQLQQGSSLGSSSVSQTQTTTSSPGSKPTIQIKQESGVKIITQQVQPSKILPKPSSVALSSSSSSPIMVVSSNGAIMTTKLVTQPTATQTTYTRPTVSPSIGARISASSGGTTYVKTTSGSIITVVPKSLATLGGKIISSNIVSGTTTKITTIPMTSKPNVIVVQKTTGKGATIQGLPGKNVVTTLLNAGTLCLPQGEKGLQAVQGTKPAIITASRPITKMIVTQPKGMSSGSQSTATKIIPTKIVYGQQGKTQVLIKPKPVFQTAVVSEQTRQLVTETLQQVTRSAEIVQGQTSGQDGSTKDESGSSTGEASHGSAQEPQPVVHVVSSREQDWTEQEVSVESSPTIIYQEVSGGESQSATSTIKALLELQQTTVKEKGESKPRQHTIDLSQMAVPIQLAQEKKPSPESPRPSTSEAEPSTEYVTAGKVSRVGVSSEDDDVVMSSSQQLGKPYKSSISQVTVVTKPVAVSSAAAASHVSHVPSDSHGKTETVLEVGEMEGDTLDPQTGLFYRSSQPASDPVKQTTHSVSTQPPPLSQAEAEQSRNSSASTQPPPLPPPPPPQLQSKPQISQPSSSSSAFPSTPPLTKKLPKLREQIQPKPQALTQSPKDRPLTAPAQTGAKVTSPGPPTKPLVTPQLPKLQQAPTSHHRPLHTPMSHPPPLQAHHPVSTEKTPSSQPIITQSATVTKITFGSSHHTTPVFSSGEATAKLIPESSSGPSGDKPSVSDILKISMMEAEIDPSTEPMVVDSSSDCGPLGKALEVQAVSGTLDSGQFISSSGTSMHHSHTKTQQFSCMQGLTAQRSKEDLEVIEVIPQYSILPDSSQSNVVVEPSGFLEITNYTSQQLEEDSPMEQEVDSSNDEATAASPPDQP